MKLNLKKEQRIYKFTIITLLSVIIVFFLVDRFGEVTAFSGTRSINKDTSPNIISYQGTLLNNQGDPITGQVNIMFRLYNHPTNSDFLWEEKHIDQNAVTVTNGLFNLVLGGINALPYEIWQEKNLYLGITVDGDSEMNPREIISAVPYAIQSEMAITVPNGSITTEKLANHMCCGTTNTDGTGWLPYKDYAIFIDVNTSSCGFSTTPLYFTSISGQTRMWDLFGANSIYRPSTTGFTVYLRSPFVETITIAEADEYDWHIQWCGIEQ